MDMNVVFNVQGQQFMSKASSDKMVESSFTGSNANCFSHGQVIKRYRGLDQTIVEPEKWCARKMECCALTKVPSLRL